MPSGRGSGRRHYPFYDLAVGQSFFVAAPIEEGAEEPTERALATRQSVLHSCGKACTARTGARFTSRRWTQEDGVRGIRVWRTE
jgi:hypothetical protein